MARKGHPRVPRAIRGQRRRQARLLRERRERMSRWRAHVPNRGLADWERELLRQGPVTYDFNPPKIQGAVLHTTNEVLRDAYSPMLEAALKGPVSLPIPMSQRG